jgi:hypothetical protein
MPATPSFFERQARIALLVLTASATFGLWFGVFLRVSEPRPFCVLEIGAGQGLVGFLAGERQTFLTCDQIAPSKIDQSPSERESIHLHWWNLNTKQETRSALDGERYLWVTGSGEGVEVVDLKMHPQLDKAVATLGRSDTSGRLSRDRRWLALLPQREPDLVVLWDRSTDQEQARFKTRLRRLTAFSEDSWYLILDPGKPGVLLEFYDLATGRPHRSFEVHGTFANELYLSPDGSWMVVQCAGRSSAGGHCFIWNLYSGAKVAEMRLGFCSFSQDGAYLATTLYESEELGPEVHIWDTRDWHECAVLHPYPEELKSSSAARFLPGGRFLAVAYSHWPGDGDKNGWLSGLLDRTESSATEHVARVRFFEVGTWCESQALVQRRGDFPEFSHDGSLVAMSDGLRAFVYDVPPRRPVLMLLALAAAPTLVMFGILWWRLRYATT